MPFFAYCDAIFRAIDKTPSRPPYDPPVQSRLNSRSAHKARRQRDRATPPLPAASPSDADVGEPVPSDISSIHETALTPATDSLALNHDPRQSASTSNTPPATPTAADPAPGKANASATEQAHPGSSLVLPESPPATLVGKRARDAEAQFWREVMTQPAMRARGVALALSSEESFWKAYERAYGKAPQIVDLGDGDGGISIALPEDVSPTVVAIMAALAIGAHARAREQAKADAEEPRIVETPAPQALPPASAKAHYVNSDSAEKPRRKPRF